MKHAFLIIAYKDYWMLNQIVQSLDDKRNDIFIHMDAKSTDFKEDMISPTRYSKVVFTERIDVSWGGDSKIRSIILLLYRAFSNGGYRYYHLMTESDYVIKDQDYFHNFFKKNDGKEFLDFMKLEKSTMWRYDLYLFFENDIGRNSNYPDLYPIEKNLSKMQVQSNTHRISKELKYYKSEGVFSITSNLVEYVLNNLEFIAHYFFNGCANDEIFLATLVMNSRFSHNIYSKKIRFIDWANKATGAHPITFTCSQYDSIIESDCIFARKFNSFVDYKVIALINNSIYGKELDNKLVVFKTMDDINDAIRDSNYVVCIPQMIVGKTFPECPFKTNSSNYYFVDRNIRIQNDEKGISDKCVAVLNNGSYQCASIKLGDKYYSMEPREGYHLFFVHNGEVERCIIDVNAKTICNPLIIEIRNSDEIPVLIDEDLEMLKSKSTWQRYNAIRRLLSRPYINISFDDVVVQLLKEDSAYSYAALASIYKDNRFHSYNVEKACHYYRKAIEMNEIWIKEQWMKELFDLLQSVGTNDSYKESIQVIEPFILSKSGYAFGCLANCYRYGQGVEKNLDLAVDYMRKAVNQEIGWVKPQYFDVLWGINTPEALKEMIEYAQLESDYGNMELRARLARAYRDGKGVDKDLNKAVDLLRTVIPGKPFWARWEYLDILRMIKTPEADAEAFVYVNTIIDSGNREYQARLARMYRDGRGTEKDVEKAIYYMRLAAEQDLVWAKIELFDMLWDLQDKKYEVEAFEIVNELSEKGDGRAMGRLARCHRDGRGTVINLDLAEQWMCNAAEKKISWANDELKQIQEMKQTVGSSPDTMRNESFLTRVLSHFK